VSDTCRLFFTRKHVKCVFSTPVSPPIDFIFLSGPFLFFSVAALRRPAVAGGSAPINGTLSLNIDSAALAAAINSVSILVSVTLRMIVHDYVFNNMFDVVYAFFV
jgi:hypothetical protein